MLKLSTEIPAQLPHMITDMKIKLYHLCGQYLTPPDTDLNDDNLIKAIEAWVQTEQALDALAFAMKQLNYTLEAEEPDNTPVNQHHTIQTDPTSAWKLDFKHPNQETEYEEQ